MSKLLLKILRFYQTRDYVKRMKEQQYDYSDIEVICDIPYCDDHKREHLLDVYSLPGMDERTPTLINIHGGALFFAYKELNSNFCFELVRRGYRVINVNYRLIPEVSFYDQILDILSVFRFLKANSVQYMVNLQDLYVVGDSAGALLSLMAVAVNNSAALQKYFGVGGKLLNVKALGLISIMLDTQRTDMLKIINPHIVKKNSTTNNTAAYLLDPTKVVMEAEMPPCVLITSEEDMLLQETLKLADLLKHKDVDFKLYNFPKGAQHELVHAFAISYPKYSESQQIFADLEQMKATVPQ